MMEKFPGKLLFRLKQYSECIRAAVAGNRTACLCNVDLFKFYRLIHGLFYQVDILLRDPGVGDKEQAGIDIGMFCKLVPYIFYQDLIQSPAVFFPYAHAPVAVVYLDAGLELQYVRTQGGDGGTASARVHKGESIKDEAGVAFPCPGPERVCDGRGVHALGDHLSGCNDEKPCPGGEVAAVYNVDMPQFFCRKAAVLVGTGQGASEIDVDDFVTFLYPGAEVVHIFLGVYSGGLWKSFMVIIFLIDLLRSDVYIIFFPFSMIWRG